MARQERIIAKGDKIDDLALLQDAKLFEFVCANRRHFQYAIGLTTNYEVYSGPDQMVWCDDVIVKGPVLKRIGTSANRV